MLAAMPIRNFALGTFYLVSGIYSLGFALFIEGLVRPISGTTAMVTATDAMFPYEMVLFGLFGAVFLLAAGAEFRRTLRRL